MERSDYKSIVTTNEGLKLVKGKLLPDFNLYNRLLYSEEICYGFHIVTTESKDDGVALVSHKRLIRKSTPL